MNIVIIVILSLIFAFLATMPFLFINTRLHENKNYAKDEIRHEKKRTFQRFIYYFVLAIVILVIYTFLQD
ncbi:hypothetical protein [Staphylococcus pseudoxylosus]|uniref:Uncharacterized protein n=1 Tax=Staphylococcus pseudoxylosus TaxID=2282419 RepID=A0AAQ0S7T6_9STAP|nr:hypothetical protein [Staphylococcus pseudoxylosus]RQM85440.1 hypothetical protein CO206_05695 [Staphylococcus xylosus]MBM2658104.1 hypothetical protein [Staphylococcus pseudoxylosus]MCE5001566.1 hypothetical protein [Staphylococcus pseudoxylosus]MDW8546180.1 hypothetical protein [Staphylococcus pseudoxylosus]MEB5782966.1 hypothetical protein [Staphylococcus pseudoxylosus]